MNNCWWGGLKAIYRWHFNGIWPPSTNFHWNSNFWRILALFCNQAPLTHLKSEETKDDICLFLFNHPLWFMQIWLTISSFALTNEWTRRCRRQYVYLLHTVGKHLSLDFLVKKGNEKCLLPGRLTTTSCSRYTNTLQHRGAVLTPCQPPESHLCQHGLLSR